MKQTYKITELDSVRDNVVDIHFALRFCHIILTNTVMTPLACLLLITMMVPIK